jgi:uncharacterized membrane protein YdbT with pleckstrin-like domain
VAFPTKLLNEGEHVVLTTRTHPKALIVPVFVLVIALAVAVLVGTLGDGGAAHVLHLAVWAVAAVVIVWWVVRPAIHWATTTYTFTNRRFMKRTGLVSRQGRTIPLNRISGVDFEVGLIDRLFGCGTLIVSDASEQGRVELDDVPHVEQVQMRVAEELQRIQDRPHDDGS